MTEGLFDRYFRLLAGQLPPQEYGVIAEPADALTAIVAGRGVDAFGVPLLTLIPTNEPTNPPNLPRT